MRVRSEVGPAGVAASFAARGLHSVLLPWLLLDAASASPFSIGVVQAVAAFRSAEWVDFYTQILGFQPSPEGQFFGILPKGTLLESPCGGFYLQLIEPPEGAEEVHWEEGLVRIGFGAPDVPAVTRELQQRGVVFIDEDTLRPGERGALTQVYLGSVTFELVASQLQEAGGG